MKQIASACLLYVALSVAANAQDCPVAPDHSADVSAIIAQIQDAENEQAARVLSNQLWEFWTDAPDESAQAVLDRGMTRRNAWDLLGAIEDFDRLIAYCPSYAEGYNQRAFAHYLRQDFQSALPDLDRAIELSPNHVAAISGRALTLLGLQRIDEAREALSQALELNPWLSERHLMAPGGPLALPGEDI
ncbi:tetratricopeptide repeat protein [Ruegeria sp. Ofav3-42]|uniref:tetratricopeptide repeat protein n=1 Tax=Ruegeria sp. Ofav3-42 TaxID=2917759 RepID=UPI001EF5DB40|nr:tetratricopeptide repeat protein [Ruegeria sp. Ofav3-42]MCG7519334.1 tetratricopeptide repeat protein [Ruegeria sp. Ofav3-42]